MVDSSPLTKALVAGLGAPLNAQAVGGDRIDCLEELLAELVQGARTAWPDVELEAERFLAHLAGRLPPDRRLEDSLRSLRAADLFLACACLAGDARALACFEERYMGPLGAVVRRAGASDGLVDEVRQRLRRELLVAEPGRAASLASYAGRGDLGGWLRVVAARETRRLLRGADRGALADHEALLVALEPADPEVAFLKQRYREEFRAALTETLGALTPRQRSLLRYQLIEGLGAEEMARVYRSHRATVNRWLADVRLDVLTGVRTRLMEKLRLSRSEVDSVMRLIDSRLDLSLPRLLENK